MPNDVCSLVGRLVNHDVCVGDWWLVGHSYEFNHELMRYFLNWLEPSNDAHDSDSGDGTDIPRLCDACNFTSDENEPDG
jgi:hypothetical protein